MNFSVKFYREKYTMKICISTYKYLLNIRCVSNSTGVHKHAWWRSLPIRNLGGPNVVVFCLPGERRETKRKAWSVFHVRSLLAMCTIVSFVMFLCAYVAS